VARAGVSSLRRSRLGSATHSRRARIGPSTGAAINALTRGKGFKPRIITSDDCRPARRGPWGRRRSSRRRRDDEGEAGDGGADEADSTTTTAPRQRKH
jgi:hypothetical protein